MAITKTCSAPTAVYLGTDFCVDASSNGTYVCVGGGIS